MVVRSIPPKYGNTTGVPTFPSSLCISIEALALCIRTSPGLGGLSRGSFEERIGLYADDLILYLADPGRSLERVLFLIESFGEFSGLKINWSKSHIRPLDTFACTSQQVALALQWCSSIKYLGKEISRPIPVFHPLNLSPLVKYIRMKTGSWARLPLSVVGRANIVKKTYNGCPRTN